VLHRAWNNKHVGYEAVKYIEHSDSGREDRISQIFQKQVSGDRFLELGIDTYFDWVNLACRQTIAALSDSQGFAA